MIMTTTMMILVKIIMMTMWIDSIWGDAGDDDNDHQVRTLAGSVADLGGGREERVQRAITYPRN